MAEYVTDEILEEACKRAWPNLFCDNEEVSGRAASPYTVASARMKKRGVMLAAIRGIAPIIAKRAAEEMREKAAEVAARDEAIAAAIRELEAE